MQILHLEINSLFNGYDVANNYDPEDSKTMCLVEAILELTAYCGRQWAKDEIKRDLYCPCLKPGANYIGGILIHYAHDGVAIEACQRRGSSKEALESLTPLDMERLIDKRIQHHALSFAADDRQQYEVQSCKC